MTRISIFFVSFRFYSGSFLSYYFSSKHTSVVFSGLCFVMNEKEVSLKRGHQPSHDTPGKPRSKRRSSVSPVCSVSPVSKPVRRSISSSFSSKTTAESCSKSKVFVFVFFTINCYFVFITFWGMMV